MLKKGAIGVFDSGYGGLTILQAIQEKLPDYDYIYLGDNARVPYGPRSFNTVYEYTKQCAYKLWEMDCPLVILACNTASAKALRNIQHKDLPVGRKILGVIRPTTEKIGHYSLTGHIGILATEGTVKSLSYQIEIERFFPGVSVFQQACPFWVPLVENNEIESPGAHYFIEREIKALLAQSPKIDTIVLACTHYPLLLPIIRQYTPKGVTLISQGELVANSLEDYLQRHSNIEERCTKNQLTRFFTTEQPQEFTQKASLFTNQEIKAGYCKVD